MQVIRLEHPNTGRGPYTWLHADPIEDHPGMVYGCGYQPCFTHDGDHPAHWKYGFLTQGQAERWWDEEARRSAEANGFQLAVYEVDPTHVIADPNQCVFDPEVARLVAHIPAAEWLDGKLNMLLQVYCENS